MTTRHQQTDVHENITKHKLVYSHCQAPEFILSQLRLFVKLCVINLFSCYPLFLSKTLFITLPCSLFGDFARATICLAITLFESLPVTKGGLNALHREHTVLLLEEDVVLNIYSLIFFSNNSSPVVSDGGTWHYIRFHFFKDGVRQGSFYPHYICHKSWPHVLHLTSRMTLA